MSIKITQAAIEAGAIALQRIFPNEFVHSKAKELAYAVLYWANEHLQPDCKVPPQTVQSTPATATQVAIDDEVERVAMAIHDAFKSYGVGPWSSLTKDHKNAYMSSARAAIRAIREGGQRWGVRLTWDDGSEGWHGREDADFVTHDKDAAEEVSRLFRQKCSDLAGCKVSPYPGEREKTAEEIADEWVKDLRYGQCPERVKEIRAKLVAAIRDAKESSNGK